MSVVLVIYIYAGIMAKGDSVTLTTVRGFGSMRACQTAGEQASQLTAGSFKELRFVCVVRK